MEKVLQEDETKEESEYHGERDLLSTNEGTRRGSRGPRTEETLVPDKGK